MRIYRIRPNAKEYMRVCRLCSATWAVGYACLAQVAPRKRHKSRRPAQHATPSSGGSIKRSGTQAFYCRRDISTSSGCASISFPSGNTSCCCWMPSAAYCAVQIRLTTKQRRSTSDAVRTCHRTCHRERLLFSMSQSKQRPFAIRRAHRGRVQHCH